MLLVPPALAADQNVAGDPHDFFRIGRLEPTQFPEGLFESGGEVVSMKDRGVHVDSFALGAVRL
jgi:hypothetical protein